MTGSKKYRPKLGYDIRINPDPPKRPAPKAQRCGTPGCAENAEWRVPKSREHMDERIWLCRQHLRAHNENWNYFAGMSEDQIQRHLIEAIIGHRPTWPLGRRAAGTPGARNAAEPPSWRYRYEDGFAVFEEAAEPAKRPARPRLTKAQLDALTLLNLEETATLQEVKARYKELVKRFHPDANGGNRGTEERLRQVIKAYGHLRATGFA